MAVGLLAGFSEEIARFLTEPTVSGILLSIGMLALAMTFYTQNFGLLTLLGLGSTSGCLGLRSLGSPLGVALCRHLGLGTYLGDGS